MNGPLPIFEIQMVKCRFYMKQGVLCLHLRTLKPKISGDMQSGPVEGCGDNIELLFLILHELGPFFAKNYLFIGL